LHRIVDKDERDDDEVEHLKHDDDVDAMWRKEVMSFFSSLALRVRVLRAKD